MKTKHSGRIEVKRGLQAIQAMRETWISAYKAACKHDGIPVDSKFSVFSDDNPFVPYVNKAYEEYCTMKREYNAGGYVGLTL